MDAGRREARNVHLLKPVGTFACVGSDGRVYLVEAAQEYASTRTAGGRNLQPVRPVVLCEGRGVVHVDKGRYRTPAGVELSTDEPNAP